MNQELNNKTGFLSYFRLTYGPWQAFERAIARLLAHRGWDSYDVVGGAWDKGADIIASMDDHEVIFQVKFSTQNSPLSVDIVGDIKRAIDFYKIKNGVCVSNRQLGPIQKRKYEVLVNQGYEIQLFTSGQLIDAFNDLPTWCEDKKQLRPYQLHAIEQLIKSYKNGETK